MNVLMTNAAIFMITITCAIQSAVSLRDTLFGRLMDAQLACQLMHDTIRRINNKLGVIAYDQERLREAFNNQSNFLGSYLTMAKTVVEGREVAATEQDKQYAAQGFSKLLTFWGLLWPEPNQYEIELGQAWCRVTSIR